MGTSIVLNDVVFSNKNLPVISELINDGLVAAFRPTLSIDSLIDISGNGYQATIIGNPEFHNGYMSGFSQNGFRIEAAETESVTLITVARVGYNSQRASAIAIPISSRWDTANAQRGCGVFFNLSGLNYISSYQAYLKSLSDGTMLSKFLGAGKTLLTLESATDETKTEWVFLATTFNAVTNEIIQYIPRYDVEAKKINLDATVSGRRITNPSNGQMNRFEVCSAGGYTGAKGNCDVAEAMYFNKALTKTQILEQYSLSKSFFEKNRAIVI